MSRDPEPHVSRWDAFTQEERDAIADGLIGEYEARKNDPGNPDLERLADVAGEMLHELRPDSWR